MTCLKNNCCSTRCFHAQTFTRENNQCCTQNDDIHLDLYACPPKCPIIWGNVYDNNGCPIEGSLVQLVSCDEMCQPYSHVLCQTRSDVDGYYELQLPTNDRINYRIVVNNNETMERQGCGRKNNICYF